MSTDVHVATLAKLPAPSIFTDTKHKLSFHFISIVSGSLIFFRPSQQFIFFSDPLKDYNFFENVQTNNFTEGVEI